MPQQDLGVKLAIVSEIQEKITEADRALLAAAERRLALARQERDFRAEQGLPAVDGAFEHRLAGELRREARELSPESVTSLVTVVIMLCRRELGVAPDGKYDQATTAIPY